MPIFSSFTLILIKKTLNIYIFFLQDICSNLNKITLNSN